MRVNRGREAASDQRGKTRPPETRGFGFWRDGLDDTELERIVWSRNDAMD
jgi:hypothetical protein